MISHNRPLDRINNLLQAGLADVPSRLAYYRMVLQDPSIGFNNVLYRECAARSMSKILDYILNDSQLYNRFRQLLLDDNRISRKAFESLEIKAEKAGIPLDILVEVYRRGYESKNYINLTPEQMGFNRVNSFIAGGEARNIDHDLLKEMQEKPEDREVGSTSLLQTFKNDTPGQGSTLKTIRKLIKEKK